jgi:hypothetical protein
MIRWLIALTVGSISMLTIALGAAVETESTATGGVQGNVNCAGQINGLDVLAIAQHVAGVNPTPLSDRSSAGGCPHIGTSTIGGYPWGDVNCSNAVTIEDMIPPLEYAAGLPVKHFANCVDVGQQIGGPTPTPSPSPSPTPFTYVCPSFGWSVAAGSATWGCESADRISLHVTDGEHILLKDGVTLTDTHLEADVSTANREAALVFRAQDGLNAYVAVFIPNGTPFASGVQLYKLVGGGYFILDNQPLPSAIQVNEVAHFEVDAVGNNIVVKVNGATVIDLNDDTYASGQVGLRAFASPGQPCDSVWDNIEYHEIP